MQKGHSEQDSESLGQSFVSQRSTEGKRLGSIQAQQQSVDPNACMKGLLVDVTPDNLSEYSQVEKENHGRPPSPSPFSPPHSLDINILPANQYDFEWGKHSPLARAVVVRNWNNPMDSDSDPDEMY